MYDNGSCFVAKRGKVYEHAKTVPMAGPSSLSRQTAWWSTGKWRDFFMIHRQWKVKSKFSRSPTIKGDFYNQR